VPDLVGVFRQLDTLGFLLSEVVEQAQLHFAGVSREDREIHPEPVPGRAQGERQAFA
jgi:hypothetical protein